MDRKTFENGMNYVCGSISLFAGGYLLGKYGSEAWGAVTFFVICGIAIFSFIKEDSNEKSK